MTRMTPSEAFVETLAAHGVTDIFGSWAQPSWMLWNLRARWHPLYPPVS
ncbi:MAG: hypothetical protein CM1200mP41_07330 [Gammaproteobacteria bacterium]|nr:MAG: hypothetical protein CM1200mP41_07330 [Gammaproteobacteria bacterium]